MSASHMVASHGLAMRLKLLRDLGDQAFIENNALTSRPSALFQSMAQIIAGKIAGAYPPLENIRQGRGKASPEGTPQDTLWGGADAHRSVFLQFQIWRLIKIEIEKMLSRAGLGSGFGGSG